ncbi:MAG: Mbov_0395 family pilin-like conjugal transfer protein [Candidatus Saccharimonadales bacterium]
MRRFARLTGYMLGAATVVCLMAAGSVLAANPLCPSQKPDDLSQEAYDKLLQSEICQVENDPIAGPSGLISDITGVVAVVGGIAAVVFIMVGGFKFVTSGGDSGKVQEAKKTIMWSVIGLVVIVMARTIIVFVINRV